jgi:murein DD-endopeptidase MepM/ murein hydrolase activator NlpD
MKKIFKWMLISLITIIVIGLGGLSFYLFLNNTKLLENNAELIEKLDSTSTKLEMLNLKFENLGTKAEMFNQYLTILEERDREMRSDLLFFSDVELYNFQNKLASINDIIKVKDIPGLQHNMDNLGKRILLQSNKYDTLSEMVKENISFLLCVPIIKPIQSKDLYSFTSDYGYRIDPINKQLSFHEGLDIATRKNALVLATGWGHVEKIIYSKYGYGNRILINHGYGYKTLYAHLNIIHVKRGAVVKRGQIIGRAGSTGRSTGVHLHYEIYKDGTHINPINHFYSYRTGNTNEFKKLMILQN